MIYGLGFILVVLFAVIVSTYITHIEMNIKEKLPYDFVNFNTFMKEFGKYKYNPKLEYDSNYKSIFLKKEDDYKFIYLHASIVRMDGKCMVFYPISWFRYRFWMKHNFRQKKNSYRVKGLWLVK